MITKIPQGQFFRRVPDVVERLASDISFQDKIVAKALLLGMVLKPYPLNAGHRFWVSVGGGVEYNGSKHGCALAWIKHKFPDTWRDIVGAP